MPVQIEFEGTIHEFPDDFTDADIAAALGGASGPQATPPPASATIGMMAQSTPDGDPKKRAMLEFTPEASAMLAPLDERSGGYWDTGGVMDQSPFANPVSMAKKTPGVIARGLGVSKARAGQNIGEALEAGKDLRVPLGPDANNAAMRARELAGSGKGEINQFFDRLTNPKVTKYRGDDLLAREAQDFVTKFGDMSATGKSNLSGPALKEVRNLRTALRAALKSELDTVGAGDQYMKGVNEYRRAAQAAKAGEKVVKYGGGAGAAYLGLGWLKGLLSD